MFFCGTSTILNWVHRWGRHCLPSEMEYSELFYHTGVGLGTLNSPSWVLQGRGCSPNGITALLRLEKTSKVELRCWSNTASLTAKMCPQMPHLYTFLNLWFHHFPVVPRTRSHRFFSLSLSLCMHMLINCPKNSCSHLSLWSPVLKAPPQLKHHKLPGVVKAEVPLCP